MQLLTAVLPTLLVFGVIVLVHEIGHFAAAKKAGIFVEEFAVGLGPKLFGIKRGETLFSLRLLPLGGFCKMLGEDGESVDPRSFNRKPVSARIVVIIAGVVMNVLLAAVLFLGLVLTDGFYDTRIHSLTPGFPAEKAGMLPGDQIVKIGNSRINIYEDIFLAMYDYKGGETTVTIRRDGELKTFALTPQVGSDGLYKIGFIRGVKTGFFSQQIEGIPKAGFWESAKVSMYTMVYNVKAVYYGLFKIVSLNASVDEMSGPIGIGALIGESVEQSAGVSVNRIVLTLLNLIAMLSVNLAVLNLLPIPGLDGGRLIFLIIELIRKRPLDQNREAMIHFVGLVALMAFAVFVAFNDVMKFF